MKKKILFVTNLNLDKAGVQTVLMNIIRNLNSEYIFDILMFSNDKSYYDEEFLALGGQIFRVPSEKCLFLKKAEYYFRMQKIYKETLKILKKYGPYDAVHCHNEYEAGICLAAAKKANVQVRIAHTHIIHSKSHILRDIYDRVYKRIIEKNATHKIGCSKEACESFYKTNTNVTVINNPYDSKKFFYMDNLDEKATAPSLVQIGSFSDNKNQLFTIDVISEIKKEFCNVKLNFVGFDLGNILSDMNEKIKEKKLGQNITVCPFDSDLASLLQRSSGLIFPSKKEGFGIVAIEAQAVGVKCYLSDSIPNLVDCGGCEYISLKDGATVWAKKIIADFKKNKGRHMEYDCSAFAADKIAGIYDRIYGGAKF